MMEIRQEQRSIEETNVKMLTQQKDLEEELIRTFSN